MDSKKRILRHDDVSSETSSRPIKKANLGDGGFESENQVNDYPMKETISNCLPRVLQSHLQTAEATNLAKPTIITPHNSFLEPRRVSQVFDNPTEPLRPNNTSAGQDDSSESSRESPVFQLSVEKNESLVAPTSTAVWHDNVRRVSLVEPHDAKPFVALRETAVEEKRQSPKAVPLTVEQSTNSNKHSWGPRALIAITALFVWACFLLTPRVIIDDPESIYVPGGGFSGFWFTLGRLNSIEDPLSKRYYCYSAGCLGAVAMLSNITMESAYGYAVGAQKRWQRGELSRYDVTETFINGLLYGSEDLGPITTDPRPAFEDPRILSTLRIITSERKGSLSVKAAIRTPENVQELKEMLLQTAWIPFAITRDLWHFQHMDGAFTLHEHPRCPTDLGYGLDWDIILNVLNVNLGYDKVALLWQKGLSMGI